MVQRTALKHDMNECEDQVPKSGSTFLNFSRSEDFATRLSVCVCVFSCFSHVRLFATLWTKAYQAPLSMGIH